MAARLAAALTKSTASYNVDQDTIEYLAGILQELVNEGNFDQDEWLASISPTLSDAIPSEDDIAKVCAAVISAVKGGGGEEKEAAASVADNKEDSRVLVFNPNLTLGFMNGKILLKNTVFKLEKGKRYGLVGNNGTGKSTLLGRIAAKELPDFPKNVRTTIVEHDISGDQTLTVLDWLRVATKALGVAATDKDLTTVLNEVGFQDLTLKVGTLSGGWRMRLGLAKAVLAKTDLLLLDEPTNHLDFNAVRWLEGFLQTRGDVTVLLVSHDPPFLDAVVTDIIHINDQRLTVHPGNYTNWNAGRPEISKEEFERVAKERALTFVFPKPVKLFGISPTRNMLKMVNADFSYQGTNKVILRDVSISMKMRQRIAVVGGNGAGKSTLIKLLVGELPIHNPELGKFWRHQDLQIAYVAQHSFHHIESHLEKTPIEYLQDRFKDGLDKESMVVRAAKEEKEENLKGPPPKHRRVEAILGRRKYKNSLAYEIKWLGEGDENNSWESLETLQAMGEPMTLVALHDEEIRARKAGMNMRPLTNKEVTKHLEDFGLVGQYATGRTVQLSGGQRSRLVLAAAMWTRPHILILDEPTNFLDLDALGALSRAIKSFKGGVLMVSHNDNFLTELCDQVWRVGGGQVLVEKTKLGQQMEEEEEAERLAAAARSAKS